jgi:hypothetical protein
MRAMTRQASRTPEIEEKSGSARGIRWNLDDALPAHSGKIFNAFGDQLSSILGEFELSGEWLDQQITSEFFTWLFNEYEEIVKTNSRLEPSRLALKKLTRRVHLSEAGFDISSRAFWKCGFEELGRVVAELRRVV